MTFFPGDCFWRTLYKQNLYALSV